MTENHNAPTVFVVDDDAAVRASLCALFETKGYTVECFRSADHFLEAYDPDWAGCLVLDVRMPGMSGPKLQEQLARYRCTLPLIFLSGHASVAVAAKALRDGAVDFIEKPGNNRLLLERVEEALVTSEQAHTERLRRHALENRIERLTPREREVMDLVVEGHPTKVIADRLGISPKTADIHRSRVMHKMEAGSVAELVRMVLQ